MLPRECDKDNCDYETGVDSAGRARAWWVHVPPCNGPVDFGPGGVGSVPPEYLIERS
jgi:hypothetical protein